MKKFYLFMLIVMAAMVGRADVITEKPEGNLKLYQRTSGLTFLNDGYQLHLQYQSGFTEIVYSADGTKAWIKNPISGFFSGASEDVAWIEGLLSGDGKTLTVKLGQEVFFDINQSDYLILATLDKDASAHDTNYLFNSSDVQVKYSIDGDKVTLLNTSENKILGLVWSSDKSWCGYGDYESVYTEYVLPEMVTPPASMSSKTYNLSAIEYMNEADAVYASEVNVGFDGNDVYIQGLDKFIPTAWVKGTNANGKVTFPVQYIGTDPAERRHFLTGWTVGTGGVADLVLNYYEDLDAFECTSPVIINSNPTMHSYYAYYRSLYIGDRPDPVELPEGLKPVHMTMKGQFDNTGLAWFDFTRTIDVAVDGDNVYFKGLSYSLPDAWVVGTLSGGVLTIPSGQFMGFDDQSAVYLHGMNAAMTEWQDIVLNYDEENNSYTSACTMIEASAREPRSYLYRYKPGFEIYFDADAPTGADPDDLTALPYVFSGQCYSRTDLITDGNFTTNVKVARDGNLVYVKGFSPELPDAWVKGEMIDNVVTFAKCQLLGNDGTQDLYFTGGDIMDWTLNDFRMSYNPDDESYTFVDIAFVNKNDKSPSYTVWYYKECKLTKDTSGIEGVTVEDGDKEPVVYNLQGLRVYGELQNGQIYIVNGKKVLVRK